VKDLLAAVKANPGSSRPRAPGRAGIWHLALAGLLKDQGLDPASVPWVPSNGAAPGLQDLVSGGVEVVPCSIPEARSLIDAGKVRALAIMDAAPPALYPNMPTLKKELGSDWTMAAWRAIAAPKGLAPDVQAKLVATIEEGARLEGVPRLHGRPRLRRDLAGTPGRGALHDEVGCGSGCGDEIRRHRKIT
jgi:tripartite-type tricarboxylate transporter receptor subunit TctC